MKALAMSSFDASSAVIEVPDPVAGPGEVLVRVGAASVNPFDAIVAVGGMKDYMPYEFPACRARKPRIGRVTRSFLDLARPASAPLWGIQAVYGQTPVS
jgi:hypothetical protein